MQQALAQSAGRAPADKDLAEAVRMEQDLGLELAGLYQHLAQQLSAPPDQQLTKVIADMRVRIQAIAGEQATLAGDIAKRFPAFLVNSDA